MKQYFAVGNWHDAGTGPFPTITYDVLSNWEWRDKPKEFKREIRYQVYKRKDIDKMPDKPRKAARALLAELDALLAAFDVPYRKCVVVEEDWPEYEKVWQMIEERVTKHTHEIKLSLPPRVSPKEPSVTYTPPIKLDNGGSLEVTKPAEPQRLLYLHCAKCHRVTFTESTNTICSQCGTVNAESAISPHMVAYIQPTHVHIDPARQGGDYGCRLECTVQPDGAVQVENVELQEAREELARVRAELELFTTSVRRRESELSAELDHVKQVNAELMQGLKRLLRLGNGGTLFTAKHLDSVVNGYFGSKAELALRHAIK